VAALVVEDADGQLVPDVRAQVEEAAERVLVQDTARASTGHDGDVDKGRLAYAGKVGTGFDEATLASLHRTLAGLERKDPAFTRGALPKSGVHWVEPKLVGQVGFSEWTTAGELRHPRYEGLRRDKDPASVIREKPQGVKP
jgi:ATP-dependent DNA ligase